MDWRILFGFLLTIGCRGTTTPEPAPQKQCRDHYLAGEFQSKVLPLSNGRQIFKIECEFSDTMYPPMPVGTMIRNALQTPFYLKDKKKTVAYQITERNYLISIIKSAKSCNQQLEIVWPPQPTEATSKILQFTTESITGKQFVFKANYSQGITQTKELSSIGMVGVLHLLPDSNNFTANISLSALRCFHDVIVDKNCEFEQHSLLQDITVSTTSASEFSFAFRTDQPSGALLQFITPSGREVKLELHDGYILRFGDMRHPVKLLSDGHWHTVIVDLKKLILFVDGQHNPGLAIGTYLRDGIRNVRITVKGMVSKIQLDQGPWECRGSMLLTTRGNTNPEPLRQICQKDQPSYCQCKAPASALSHNASSPMCSTPNIAKAWSFDRDPRKLTFLFMKTPTIRSSVSVLFRSDADSGLVLFGQRNDSGETERFQVEFEGKVMTAGACLTAEGTMSCRSCRIERPSGFGANQWIRVTLFKQQQYVYLTVDDQVCTLSPNVGALDRTRMYTGPAGVPFLFVGGSHYMKSKELESVKSKLKYELNNYYDHTHQKALSLRGCIAEVYVDGVQINLQKVFHEQAKLVRSPAEPSEIFAMTLGCSDCSMECGQFACRRVGQDHDVCDCGLHFGMPSSTSNTCNNKADPISLIAKDYASLEYRYRKPANKRVSKWWIHLLLPNSNDELYPVVTVGDFIISVGDYGQTILITASDYQISEKFEIVADDARLHLISMEETNESPEKKDFIIRVDNQSRRLKSLYFSNYDVIVNAMKKTSESESGCVSGIYFALDGEVEEPSSLSFVDVLHDHPPIGNAKKNLTLMATDTRLGCGILDPQLWESGSSSLGFVGDYDPHGDLGGTGFSLILIYVVIILLLIAVLVAVIVYFCRNHRTHKYIVDRAAAEREPPEESHQLLNESPKHNENDAHGFEKKGVVVPKAVIVQEKPVRR